jgi:hypothetical protein
MEERRATRGSITRTETGTRLEFMFNPNSISDEKAVTYASQGVPGVSHPVEQYAGGGQRKITFEIYLDADRGRGQQRANDANRADKNGSIDIADELRWYRSFLYPKRASGEAFADVEPHTVLFTFGELYKGVPCVVYAAAQTITKFDPLLRPLRATIAVTLVELVESGQSSDDVYRVG